MIKKKTKVAIAVFLLIAALTIILRYMFIHTSFWYDEACSWMTAKQEFPFGIIDYLLNKDLQHTPLYFFILHFWIKLFGSSEYSIKFLSLIFGIGTIPLVYTACKKLTDKKIAIYTTIISAISPVLVYFSTEARMYPMVAFLVMLSLNYLIDFEKKKSYKSLIKLVIVNVLIPYTLVGGILYNISLAAMYSYYLIKTNKEKIKKYLIGLGCEAFMLIPYFLMIIHYAALRKLFVISHEGTLSFTQIVDAIRNFFGLELATNVYWPSQEPYYITFTFLIFIIIPCTYLIYGIVQGYKNTDGFTKLIYKIFIFSFILSIITAALKIHVFTVRYILYLIPPMLIMAMIGLSKKISKRHLLIFLVYFSVFGILGDIKYYAIIPTLKRNAFEAVAIEAQQLNMTVDDMVIMPFGSDAPYYFKGLTSPRVYEFDYHKEFRNPYNDKVYTKEQQRLMDKPAKYGIIYDSIYADKDLSYAHYNYFYNNVISKIESGRYLLIALYGDDNKALVSPDDLKTSTPTVVDVKQNIVEVLLKKYLIDIRSYLDNYFVLLKMYEKGNYTYLYLQKR